MQVQRIQSNNTTFRYNPLVNAKLMNDLANAKKNKAYCEYIRNLCRVLNDSEQKLREAEKKRMPQLVNCLAATFIPMKAVFCDMIDEHFPNYNYKQKELESYSEEVAARNIDENPRHWLNALVKFLNEHIEDDAELLEDGEQMTAEEQEDNSLAGIMRKMFPGATIVSASMMRAVDNDEDEIDPETDETGEAQTQQTNDAEAKAEMIKLGKDKVVEFTPEGNAAKGFDGLGGMKELKSELQDKVIDFLKDPEQAKLDNIEYGTKLPKGLLLYGPPGCGKTTVVKHLAVEAGVPLFKLETGSLKTSYYHETSKNIDAAFEYAASRASKDKPAIMLIDDGDSFFVARNERTTQFEGEEMTTFLNKIQEAPDKNVMVALTTNKYDIMDKAVTRRFDTQVYVGLPDEEARTSLLKFFFNQNVKSNALAQDEEAIKRLAKKLENFPISAIEDMAREACDIPRREAKAARAIGKTIRREVTEADFEKVLEKPENQNKKIKEQNYKTNATRQPIGF